MVSKLFLTFRSWSAESSKAVRLTAYANQLTYIRAYSIYLAMMFTFLLLSHTVLRAHLFSVFPLFDPTNQRVIKSSITFTSHYLLSSSKHIVALQLSYLGRAFAFQLHIPGIAVFLNRLSLVSSVFFKAYVFYCLLF